MGDVIEVLTTATNTVEVEAAGPQGVPGVGVPTGGSALQVLRKASSTDYDTEWSSSGGGSVDLSSPDPIGDVTPNTGAFTTLSATGTATLPHIHGSLAGNLYIHVKNVSGGELTRGTPVYIVGNVGDTDRVEVAAADFDDATKMPAVGLLEQTLANNGSGDAIILGELDEANTNAYTINQELFVGNNGTLTATRPTTGQVQSAGVVARVNSNTGVIVVNMQGQRSPNETFAAASHSHGNLTNAGAIGTTVNLPLITGTNGVVEAGSFGTAAGSFCEGNDARLSDARTPSSTLAHAASHAAGTKASFFGTVSGMTGNVWIIADNAGAAGNSIELSFDGVDNIDTVLGAWNSANPSNTAAFAGYGGDAAQVPDNGETITLSGGAAAGSDALPYDSTPRFDSLNVGGGEINNWVTNGEHIAQFVAADGTSVKPFTGIGGSANFELFQDSLLSSGFSHGLCIPGQPPDGIYRLTLYNGSSWNPKIIVPQTGTIGIEENLSLRDRDNEFAATFDVQNQLSDDVTLTIPDQSGTIAVTTDIPTTAGDVGAVAAGAITTSGLTQATARILGRTTASTGSIEEIQIGSGLSLSAGELSATGGSGGVTGAASSASDVLGVSGADITGVDGGLINSANPAVVWDDVAGKLVYANPLARPSGAGSMFIGLAPSTTALGTNAINIQTSRSTATEVADGTSCVAIGVNTRARTFEAVAIGRGSDAGSGSVAIGGGASTFNNPSGAVAIGRTASAGGTGSPVAIGWSSSASGERAIGIGQSATASSINGVALGLNTTANLLSQLQTIPFSSVYWGGTTTNATPLILNLDATATNRFTIAASTALAVDILLVARRSDTQDKWLVARRFLGIRRDGSNNTSLIGSVQTLGIDQSAGSPTWTFALTADDTNEALQLEVTGAASETIQWRATAFYRVA